MNDVTKIFLCAGTYIYKLRRFCSLNNRDSMPVKNNEAAKRNSVTDRDLLLTLLAIGHVDYRPPKIGNSFKTHTSDFINCKIEISPIRDIRDKESQLNKAKNNFNNDIQSGYSDSLKIITQFVDCCELKKYEEKITEIMPELTVCDFKLSQMVIARNIGREYIMIMRKMSLKDPFIINTEQKDSNSGLGCEDHFSAVDDQGVEFAVYNECCEASDRKYSEDAENMMRIELLCSKCLIHDLTKKLDTGKAILRMLRSADNILNNFYTGVFKYRTNLFYISRDRQKRFIKKKYNDKAVRKELLEIIKEMRCSNVDLDMVLCEHYYNRAKKDMMMEFTEMGFSPIPIRSDRFSFISPLDFVLGFCNEYKYQGLKENACYNEIKHSIDSEKEMFEYDPFRSSNQIVLPEVNQVNSE